MNHKSYLVTLALVAVALLLAATAQTQENAVEDPIAGDHPVIRLWPIEQVGGEQNRLKEEVTNRGKIRYENVKDPHLVVYQIQRAKPTLAVIYCPGGAYKHLTPQPQIIEWLNDCGITVFMLKYTVPDDREAALRDVQRAMRVVRYNAKKWNINPEQLGVLGSSAGGHLVARLSQDYTTPAYEPIDEADQESCEPAFVILTWAAYLLEGKAGPGLAEEFHMKNRVAPTFLVYGKDDKFSTGGIAYEKALKATGTPTQLKLYEKGGHGLKDVDWYPECREWVRELGINLTEEKQKSRPNIILIMADDIAYDNNFGAYGARESWTPRLDQLAKEGITFTYAYSCPKCTPSRVKLMTGRSGIRNYIGFGSLLSTEVTFAHMLRKAGYKTHVAGKWQLDGKDGTATSEAGFDSWFLWNTALGRGSRYWEPNFDVNGKHVVFGKEDYGPDLCVKSILEFVEKNKEGPFLVYYPMLLVHGPFETTPDSEERERKDSQKNFEDMIKYMDTCVGRVIDGLKKYGLDENTVVLFCSDNGTNRALTYESFGKIVDGKKGVPHDRGTHSPLIVHSPKNIPAGARCADMIDFTDVLPTLAEIGGAELPTVELDGRSFWPQCKGKDGTPREWIFQYYWPKAWSWIPDELGEEELVWVHNQNYKLHKNGLFYDIVKDREELNPLPLDQLTDQQKKACEIFKKAIASMPETNPAYQKKMATKAK